MKAELSSIGSRHPQVWAEATNDQDAGARLAFSVSIRNSDGHETFETYPTTDSPRASCKANTLVDELNGDLDTRKIIQSCNAGDLGCIDDKLRNACTFKRKSRSKRKKSWLNPCGK